MTSEEIIEKLLSEKKISAKEAFIILKDLAKIGLHEIGKKVLPEPLKPVEPEKKEPFKPWDNIVCMYGVVTNPWNAYDDINTISSKDSFHLDDAERIKKSNNRNR